MTCQQLVASDRSSETKYSLIPSEDLDHDETKNSVEPADWSSWCLRTQQPLESRCSQIERMLESTTFQIAGAVLILANAAVIGLETDHPAMFNWDAIEQVFLLIFTLELFVKISALGPHRFFSVQNQELEWNLLDSAVVSCGLLELAAYGILRFFVHGEGSEHRGPDSFATLLRIVRLLRLVRIFRLFRFLKRLYLLMVGLAEAVRATFWVTLLVVIILYTIAIVTVRLLGHMPPGSPGSEFLHSKFGNVGLSMMSLFEITASPDLKEYQDAGVLLSYPQLTLFLVVWVIFGSFGLVAMLTGVISECMFEKNQARKEEVHKEHEEKMIEVKKWCTDEWTRFRKHKGHPDDANKADIEKILPTFKSFCSGIEIEISNGDLENVVDYMDERETGWIHFSDFVHCMVALTEADRPVSFQEIKHLASAARVSSDQSRALCKSIIAKLASLEHAVHGIALLAPNGNTDSAGNLSERPGDRVASRRNSKARTVAQPQTKRLLDDREDPAAEKAKLRLPPLPIGGEDHQIRMLNVPYLNPSEMLSAAQKQADVEDCAASRGTLLPKLSAMEVCVDGAITSFLRLKRHVQELASGARKCLDHVNPPPVLDCNKNGIDTVLREVADLDDKARTALSPTRLETELLRVVERVRSETLEMATASLFAEALQATTSSLSMLDLINQLRILPSHRSAEGCEPDPEANVQKA